MATILIGIDINQQCTDLDFGIDLPDDVIEQIERKYKKALEESGMDDDDFGPTYFEQLKKEDKELADKIEEAAWDTLSIIVLKPCKECMNKTKKETGIRLMQSAINLISTWQIFQDIIITTRQITNKAWGIRSYTV